MEKANPNLTATITKPVIIDDEKAKENLIIKQKKSDSKPFPVLLNDLKRSLQEEAYELNISLHANIRNVLRRHVEKRKNDGKSDA